MHGDARRFRIADPQTLAGLEAFNAPMAEAKSSVSFPANAQVKQHFHEKALSHFYEKSADELREWEED